MRKINAKSLIIIIFLFFILTTGCSLMDVFNNYVQDRGRGVEKQVELTLTALAEGMTDTKTETPPELATPTPQPSATATEDAGLEMGRITGSLAYPSEVLPPQRIVAFNANDPNTYYLTEVRSGGTYTLEVQPGTYFVLAFLISAEDLGATPGLAGAYSEAVLCGLTVACEDHSLIPVVVTPGETIEGIDPVDWYQPVDQRTNWPSDPTKSDTGGIRGNLGYPSEYIPPMRVVAFDTFSQDYYYVDTQRNQNSYEMVDLPPSTYHVVAYVREQGPELAGGYSFFVTCGMTQDCSNHNLIDVNVYAGQVKEGVDPVDFYAQPGEADWPENPTD